MNMKMLGEAWLREPLAHQIRINMIAGYSLKYQGNSTLQKPQ